ncbi:chemotaxis protein CheA [Candidatus Poribacteria bacterium]|nr:chemotaxis protein CheA [Candidatus Poribacteria bacterium]
MSTENIFEDQEMIESFLEEADEIIEQLDDNLVSVETQPDDLELINAIFRGFHTIKGMGGFLGFTQLVHIAHESENVLDLLRNQELSVNPALMDIILEAVDLIKELLNDIRLQEIQTRDLSGISAKLATLIPGAGGESAAVTEAEADIEETSSSDPEDEALDSSPASFQWLQQQGVDASENASSDDEEPQEMPNSLQRLQEQDPNSQPTAAADADAEESDSEAWMETVSPDEFDATAPAIEISLEAGGVQETAEIDLDAIPVVEMSSEEIGEVTEQDLELEKDTVADFSIVIGEESDSEAWMETVSADEFNAEDLASDASPEGGGAQEAAEIDLNDLPIVEVSSEEIGEITAQDLESTTQSQERVDGFLELGKDGIDKGASPSPSKSSGDFSTQPTVEDIISKMSAESSAPQSKAGTGWSRQQMVSTTIRVDVKRLEEMMNLIGELVLERNHLLQLKKDFELKVDLDSFELGLAENSARINRLTTDLQRSILSVRMLPIGSVFKKFPRIARDIARDLNKEVELVLSGEETELDKAIVDVISEPLTHLLRNSIDHGLETPDVREAAGKPRSGKVCLSASHVGNQIIIEITDDGAGIDPEVIGRKAVEKELITEEQLAEMSKKEIFDLIFLPGFSTAEQVSTVSGRGVGMDVVRTTVRNFNGTINLESELGKGTRIELRLPLTLAIIQALIVEVGKETFAIPLSSVVETVRITPEDIQKVRKHEVLDLRNSVLPLLRLREALHCAPAESPSSNGHHSYVVVVGLAEQQTGVVVDRLIGEEEIVVKSLGNYLGNVPGIAGATIMGDGRASLILEVSTLMSLYDATE